MGWSISKFEVQIKNSTSKFTPGDTIEGTLIIVNGRACEHREISITCAGFVDHKLVNGAAAAGQSMQTSSGGALASSLNRAYHLKYDKKIAGKGTLAAGEHTFPFSFILPKSLPSSTDRVKYKVTGYMNGYSIHKQKDGAVFFELDGNCTYAEYVATPHAGQVEVK